MASSRGHDSDRSPDVKQERWLAALAAGESPTEAARSAGYKNPRSAAYDNLRSAMLARVNRERFERARALLVENPEVQAATHPLGAYVTLLRSLDARRTVQLPLVVEWEDKKTQQIRRRWEWVTLREEDGPMQLRAALLMVTLTGRNPTVEKRPAVEYGA